MMPKMPAAPALFMLLTLPLCTPAFADGADCLAEAVPSGAAPVCAEAAKPVASAPAATEEAKLRVASAPAAREASAIAAAPSAVAAAPAASPLAYKRKPVPTTLPAPTPLPVVRTERPFVRSCSDMRCPTFIVLGTGY